MKIIILSLGAFGIIAAQAAAHEPAPAPDWGTVPIGSDEPVDCSDSSKCGKDVELPPREPTTPPLTQEQSRSELLELRRTWQGRIVLPGSRIARPAGPSSPNQDMPEEEDPLGHGNIVTPGSRLDRTLRPGRDSEFFTRGRFPGSFEIMGTTGPVKQPDPAVYRLR